MALSPANRPRKSRHHVIGRQQCDAFDRGQRQGFGRTDRWNSLLATYFESVVEVALGPGNAVPAVGSPRESARRHYGHFPAAMARDTVVVAITRPLLP
jgi:hypothetical protein